MYQYVKAVALQKSLSAQWQSVDIVDVPMVELYTEYHRVVVELTNPYIDTPVCVDVAVFKDKYGTSLLTISEVLTDIGNTTLDTVAGLPNTQVKYCRYTDAFRVGYKMALCTAGRFYPPNYPKEDLTDIALSRPQYNTDMKLFHDHCLVTVNGLLHMTDTDSKYCYVYGGGDSLRKSNHNHVGIVSFLDVGKLTKIPVRPEMVFAQDTGVPFKDRAYFNLDMDLTGKYVLMSLGGYLLFPGEQGFQQVSDCIFGLNISDMPFVERLIESSKYLDLSKLGLDVSEDLPEVFNVQEALTDEVLRNYFTMSQTFFIVVEADNLFTNKTALRNSNCPGIFTAYQEPTAPLVVGYGKMAEYWKSHEDGHWHVTVEDSYYRHYSFESRNTQELENVGISLKPFNSYYNSKGHLLEIGTYKT